MPLVSDNILANFNRRIDVIVRLRDQAYALAAEADDKFAAAVGPVDPVQKDEGFIVRASNILHGRRRLEASSHAPRATAILRRFRRWERLGDLTERVWWMSRFKRFYGEAGIPYKSADELFTVNAHENKRILVDPEDDHAAYFVKRGWLTMACSGQVYGLNGAVALMTEEHENIFFSHDLIRIKPDISKVPSGYLLVALTHPTHGRPLVISAAYGTSIPHLDPGDVADFPVVRLEKREEIAIADLAERAAKARATADAAEREMASDAGAIIDSFISQKTNHLKLA